MENAANVLHTIKPINVILNRTVNVKAPKKLEAPVKPEALEKQKTLEGSVKG